MTCMMSSISARLSSADEPNGEPGRAKEHSHNNKGALPKISLQPSRQSQVLVVVRRQLTLPILFPPPADHSSYRTPPLAANSHHNGRPKTHNEVCCTIMFAIRCPAALCCCSSSGTEICRRRHNINTTTLLDEQCGPRCCGEQRQRKGHLRPRDPFRLQDGHRGGKDTARGRGLQQRRRDL